jgi:hypothetical protein
MEVFKVMGVRPSYHSFLIHLDIYRFRFSIIKQAFWRYAIYGHPDIFIYLVTWWFGTWILWLSISYMGCHPSHWRTHIFQDFIFFKMVIAPPASESMSKLGLKLQKCRSDHDKKVGLNHQTWMSYMGWPTNSGRCEDQCECPNGHVCADGNLGQT